MFIKKLIDFHCHIDLYSDPQDIIDQCEREKVYTLTVTTTPRAWPKNKELTFNKHYVKPALGLHPQLITEDPNEELSLWERYFSEARYIGEIGIDAGHKFIASINEQKRIFKYILKLCAEEGNKILTVHSSYAADIVLNFIQTFLPSNRGKVVLHWFTGDEVETRRAIELGCYFSINSEMTKTKRGRALLTKLPLERILTETDGPFIKLKNEPIKPVDVLYIIESLATLRKISTKEVLNKIFLNLKTLLEK